MIEKLITKKLFSIALLLFLIGSIFGLLIRWNFVSPSSIIEYKNLLQGHSHIAFLGWGYFASIGAIFLAFIPKIFWNKKAYKYSLLILISSVILMIFSFPISGYKAISIGLLAIFGITSYVLSYRMLKDINGSETSIRLIRYAIYYYLFSSLATWFLAYVIVSQGKTNLYYNTVYFYLHFLYNGFFVFALFGMLFKFIENQQIAFSKKNCNLFFTFLNVACIPAYTLSILWSTNQYIFNIIGFIAAFLQLISLLFLYKIIMEVYLKLKWNYISRLLLKFALIAYSLKIISQLLSSFPFIVEKSMALKPFFIIGYLHLFTLAFMSVLLMLILIQLKKINEFIPLTKYGVFLFLIGIVLTEFVLFYTGFSILVGIKPFSNYNLILFICSCLLVLGIGLLVSSRFIPLKKLKE